MKVNGEMKTFGALKQSKMLGVSLNVKMELYVKVVVSMVMYELENWALTEKLRNEEVRHGMGLREKMSDGMDLGVLKIFGTMERTSEDRLTT